VASPSGTRPQSPGVSALYCNLRDLGIPSVPEAVQAELRGLYLANVLRNELLAEELARLLSSLGEAARRVVPLKGVALAQSLYGDVAARVCVDIEFQVSRRAQFR
jgi:hypothetical protein